MGVVNFKIKHLKEKKKKIIGRNNQGKITVRHIGGGSKRQHRLIDFSKKLYEQVGVVQTIEQDPNRTAKIALVFYKKSGLICYNLCPDGIKPGDIVVSMQTNIGQNLKQKKLGFSFFLKDMPLSVPIHNIEQQAKAGGTIGRAAGSYCICIRSIQLPNGNCFVGLKLPSKNMVYLPGDCSATLGKVSNINNKFLKLSKAGQSRWLGIRPSVRGVAMNPVDHPHGGGEGKSSGGRISVSPWGVLTKGFKTLSFKQKKKKKILITRILNRSI